MRRVIPEKMVEIWTAHAILGRFGPSARVWAPTQGFDQAVRPIRGRRFLLELKAPDWTTGAAQAQGFPPTAKVPRSAVPVAIDIGQLLEYVETFESEALYVLPQPSHFRKAGGSGRLELEGHRVRVTFPGWAYVVCSSRLLDLIGGDPRVRELQWRQRWSAVEVLPADRGRWGSYQRNLQAKVVCDTTQSGTVRCHLPEDSVDSGVEVVEFGRFLTLLEMCVFDWPVATRSEGLPPSRPMTSAIPEGLQPAGDRADPPDFVDDRFDDDRFDDDRFDDDGPDEGGSRSLPGGLLVVEIAM